MITILINKMTQIKIRVAHIMSLHTVKVSVQLDVFVNVIFAKGKCVTFTKTEHTGLHLSQIGFLTSKFYTDNRNILAQSFINYIRSLVVLKDETKKPI